MAFSIHIPPVIQIAIHHSLAVTNVTSSLISHSTNRYRCSVMFPICSPRFLPPRFAFNILGRSRLTFMLDIYSSGRTSRWRCFPLKALSGRKWGGWRDSERWWPLLIQRAATFLNSLSSSLPSHAAPAESKKTFSAPPRDRYVSSPRPC